MKLNKLLIVTALVLGLTAGTVTVAPAQPPELPPWMSGHADTDFAGRFDAVFYDPDTPEELLPKPPFLPTWFSGWDVLAIYFDYDNSTDTVYVGIDCNGICGDADGNGNPGEWEGPTQGTDLPDLGYKESIAMAIDTNNDGASDVVVGVRAFGEIGEFGTYNYHPRFPFSFGALLPNAVDLYANPHAGAPDIEFSIAAFSDLPGFTPGQQCFEFGIKVFSGSFLDNGISEDQFSGQVSLCGLEVTKTCVVEPPPGGEGCTPGYWKQEQHFDSWVNYIPEGPDADWYDDVDVFNVPYHKTLLEALKTGGGGEKALGRHATAALLNAANPDVNYLYTVGEVISMVQAAYRSGDYESTKNLFETQNEAGCFIGNDKDGNTATLSEPPEPSEACTIAPGDEVTYEYTVTNIGCPVSNVTVVDDKLGRIDSFEPTDVLPTGYVGTFTKKVQILEATTNVVTVTGYLEDETKCQAIDEVTVTVEETPCPCELEVTKTCLVEPPPTEDVACEAKIAATLLKYVGPDIQNATVVFEGTNKKADGAVTYSNVDLTYGTVLSLPEENGFTIDARPEDLGAKMSITINGVLQEVHHTSCSTPYVAGQPAPLDGNSPGNPEKGTPSPTWFVLNFVDKDGNTATLSEPPEPSEACTIAPGDEVTYEYTVTNIGCPVSNVTVVDDKLGRIDSFEPTDVLPTGYVGTFTKKVQILEATTNVVTVTGYLEDETKCQAIDEVTVTVEETPPSECVAIGDSSLKIGDDKIEWKLFNEGGDTITIESITISWHPDLGSLNKIKLGKKTLYDQPLSPPPATIDSGWKGSTKDREIKSGGNATLKFEFQNKTSTSQGDYAITVNFAEGCSVEFTPGAGGQGCTPGYWKQEQHFDSWVNYIPEGPDADWYDDVDVFNVPYHKTLLEALKTGGGGEEALGRHATAALLNATNPDVNYLYTVGEVISMVQAAYRSGDYESTKNLFAGQNEAGCPLD